MTVGLGVVFGERLSGAYRELRPGTKDRPLHLELSARSGELGSIMRCPAIGVISADGLARRAEVSGHIQLGANLVYELGFATDAGRRVRLVGEKRQLRASVYAGFTTLRGWLFDVEQGQRVATVVARFDARGDVLWWLRQLRLLLT